MSTKAAADLLAALRSKQATECLNDGQFAQRLGISKTLWSLISNGKSEPSYKMLRGVARVYPDLNPHVTIFLQSGYRILNASGQDVVQESAR